MDQIPTGEVLQNDKQAEQLARIESLKNGVLSEIHLQFAFSTAEPALGTQNSYGLMYDKAGQQHDVLYVRSNELPIDPGIYDSDVYGDDITSVTAKAVITYGANVIEPEHWKRVLLRKKYIHAKVASTDEIISIDVYLDVLQPGKFGSVTLGDSVWWNQFGWYSDESPKKQVKQLKKISSVLQSVDAHRLDP
jgi:hypothetical protein